MSNDIRNPGSEAARQWMRGMLGMIKEGGLWTIPRSNTVYEILHEKKIIKRMSGRGDADTERVAKAIGWSVQV